MLKMILKKPTLAQAKPTWAPTKWPKIGLKMEIARAPHNHKGSIFLFYFVATKIRKLFLSF